MDIKLKKGILVVFVANLTNIIFGLITNYIGFLILGKSVSFAIATLLSAIVWYAISLPDFKNLNLSLSERTYIFLELGLFLFCGCFMNEILGVFLYLAFTIILTLVFMKNYVTNIVAYISNIFRKRD